MNFCAEVFILLKLRRKHFGEAAADNQAVDCGQVFVVKRAERDNFRAEPLQYAETCAVVEIERRVVGNADFDVGTRNRELGTSDFQRRRSFRELNQRVNVNLSLDRRADFLQDVIGLMFSRRHKSQMSFGQVEFVIAFECAENFYAEPVESLRDNFFVSVRAEPIQNHACKVDGFIELPEAERDCRRRSAHAFGVNDQYNGRTEQLGNFRRGADAAASAVVKPHDAFNNRNVRAA